MSEPAFIDFSKMEQFGDERTGAVFFPRTQVQKDQASCWLTLHQRGIRTSYSGKSGPVALFSGAIGALGPRYCPSIEDKSG